MKRCINRNICGKTENTQEELYGDNQKQKTAQRTGNPGCNPAALADILQRHALCQRAYHRGAAQPDASQDQKPDCHSKAVSNKSGNHFQVAAVLFFQ